MPFDAATPEEIVTQHLTTPAPAVSRFAHTAPSRLGAAVDTLSGERPAQRYRSAERSPRRSISRSNMRRRSRSRFVYGFQQGEKESDRAPCSSSGGVLGSLIAVVTTHPWLFSAHRARTAGVSFFPVLTRLRRVLKDGYVVDDLHAALREHDLLRSEEIAVRASLQSCRTQSRTARDARGIREFDGCTVLVGAPCACRSRAATSAPADANFFRTTFTFAAVFAIASRLVSRVSSSGSDLPAGSRDQGELLEGQVGRASGEDRRHRTRCLRSSRTRRPHAHRGRPRSRNRSSLPGAPESCARELADLPETIRRLEQDATKLRASIDSLDDHLAVFERSTMHGVVVVSADSSPERSEGPALKQLSI
jgi:hypothetical protein